MDAAFASHSNPIIDKLDSVFRLSDQEKAAISGLPVHLAQFERGQDIAREGDRPSRCFALLEGFTCNYKQTGAGGQQITAFHVPGDIPDLQSLHLPALDFTVTTLKACSVAFIQHEALRALCDQHPRIASAFWRETLIEGAVCREWTLNLGQRDGEARVAHLLCEMLARLEAVGLSDGSSCEFFMTQADVGAATGMTPVHVNRCLQALRRASLIRLARGRLQVPDLDALKKAADFHPAYLHLRQKAA